MSDAPPVGDAPSTSGEHPDVTSGEAIRARADARLSKRVRYLQAELDGKIALIAQLSGEIAHLDSVVADANTRIKTLERERDDARADASYQVRSFDRLLSAVQSMQTGEFAHIAAALRRREAPT